MDWGREIIKISFDEAWKLAELPTQVNPELGEAIAYFTTAEKYGWSGSILDDGTDEEIVAEYKKCLAHEYLDGDDDLPAEFVNDGRV